MRGERTVGAGRVDLNGVLHLATQERCHRFRLHSVTTAPQGRRQHALHPATKTAQHRARVICDRLTRCVPATDMNDSMWSCSPAVSARGIGCSSSADLDPRWPAVAKRWAVGLNPLQAARASARTQTSASGLTSTATRQLGLSTAAAETHQCDLAATASVEYYISQEHTRDAPWIPWNARRGRSCGPQAS